MSQTLNARAGGCFDRFLGTRRGPWKLVVLAAVPLPIVILSILRMRPWTAGIAAVRFCRFWDAPVRLLLAIQ